MDRSEFARKIKLAAEMGIDVNVDFKPHVIAILRGLIDEIQSGEVTVESAAMLLQQGKPFATYMITVQNHQ